DFQRNMVDFLAVHGGNMAEKELHRRCFPRKRLKMKETVGALGRCGFLFTERWADLDGKPRIYGLPEPFLRFIELPHFWQGHLGALLRGLPVEILLQIAARNLGLRIASHKRDRLIYAIRRALTDPATLRAYVDALPEDQREVFFLILQRRGVCLHRDLIEMIQGRRPDLAKGDAVARLLSSGLLFQMTNNSPKYQNLLRVPRDVHYIIANHFVRDNRGLQELDSINRVAPEQQPRVILDSGISILRDVVILTSYIERHAVRRLGNGGVGRNDLRRVLPRLSAHKTPKYALFLASYCIRKQILAPTEDRWTVCPTFEEILSDSRSFYLDLYSNWLETNEWNEEYMHGDCVHTDSYPTGLVHIAEMRALVLANLARIPFETWIDGPRFIESLLAQIEVRLPSRGSKGRIEKHNRINYLVIESILCESLYWLGLIALGLHDQSSLNELGNRRQVDAGRCPVGAGESGNGAPRSDHDTRLDRHFNFNPRPLLPEAYHFHFQINGLGRSLLAAGSGSTIKPPDPRSSVALPFRDDMVQFTVLPNLDVVAPPDLNLARFHRMLQFAEIRHIDIMSILTITRESLRTGMDRGLKGDEILAFLQGGCPSGLPETVRHLVSECRNRYGEISIGYAGGYVLVDDPLLLEDLRNNKVLAPHVRDVLGERIILLDRSANVQGVARELQRLGFMPSIDNENVYASSDGRIGFSLSAEDLSALMGVLRFTLQVERELSANLTEEKARSLLHGLLPTNHAQFNLNRLSEAMSKRFEKRFEAALKRKIQSVAGKYRRQIKEFLAQQEPAASRPVYTGPDPATNTKDIRELLEFAIDNESAVALQYLRATNEEIVETVKPESLNGDKLFAFCEQRESYRAYRLKRIRSAGLNGLE
ncbi:MAG TPA: helicase-associated domain-containing protein, partial [Sumerlaeia bacterium]|nr:helicase-associated domain-containing protein [Sumerlaeia bacterium]